MMEIDHPMRFAGRYLFIFLTAMPQTSENVDETIAVGRILTLDPMGPDSKQAWKYTG